MGSPQAVHVFLVSFPGQGHVNPLLRLGKCLASKGLLVTFSTAENFGEKMRKTNNITDQPTRVGDGWLRFEFLDDGWRDDDPHRLDLESYMTQLELLGRAQIHRTLKAHAHEGRPVSCLINNPFIPWASDVAEELGIPSAMLWVQSSACFLAYYYWYHGLVPFPSENRPEIDVQLPAMPLLKYDEVPSFLHPSTPYPFLRQAILGQFKNLSKPFCVLADTFHELEPDIIEHVSKFCPLKPVGPLFKNPKASHAAVRGDFMKADDCMEWLDARPASSVVYISFGSVICLKQEQVDEIAHGLLDSGVSFLWVMRPPTEGSGVKLHALPDGFLENVGNRGKVVQWAPQEQVLMHPSVTCFVTHCGWNSTLEALASGKPVAAFPQWGDQVTDAKFLADVFGVGVRMSRGDPCGRADLLVTRDEVKNCLLEATVGPKAAEMKKNGMKWRKAAEEAVEEGGSSDRNLEAFIDEVKRRSAHVASEPIQNKTTIEKCGLEPSSVT